MILILCPLPLEVKLLHKALINEGLLFKSSHGTHIGEKIVLSVGGHGKVNFALNTQKLILQYKPSLMICAGAAGGLKELNTLDVVAATKTVEHDYNIKFIKMALPSFEGDAATLKKIKNVKKVILASGDEDILDSNRANEVHEKTLAQAVAWEGAGAAKACALSDTPFLELRCITDLCNSDTVSDFKSNLEEGMNRIGKVIVDLLL